MIKFNKPNSLNGSQLCQELIAAGVKIDDPLNTCSIDEYGDFWLNIAKKDEAKAKPVVDAHVGVDQTVIIEAKRQAVLDRLGLTADEAKLLLG